MAKELIHGVKIKPLRVIPDERGLLMEMLRCDDEIFRKFGQVYLSMAYPGVVKGWHYHKVQTDYFTIVKGMMKVVLYDRREDSPTHGVVNEFFMGERNPILLVIPPLVLHGMKCISTEPAYLVNCPTEPYCYDNPDEFRVDPHDESILYDWARKDG
ncbi:MAG TPA: dTDP-4-dehydrorhamnose 3,5-epimerase family protein [Sumerlaeia bacterium]|nr:dTDP-4-dehydrorhamnose 3,5-epimerase family protein [Sumerlaeia bacterium]